MAVFFRSYESYALFCSTTCRKHMGFIRVIYANDRKTMAIRAIRPNTGVLQKNIRKEKERKRKQNTGCQGDPSLYARILALETTTPPAQIDRELQNPSF